MSLPNCVERDTEFSTLSDLRLVLIKKNLLLTEDVDLFLAIYVVNIGLFKKFRVEIAKRIIAGEVFSCAKIYKKVAHQYLWQVPSPKHNVWLETHRWSYRKYLVAVFLFYHPDLEAVFEERDFPVPPTRKVKLRILKAKLRLVSGEVQTEPPPPKPCDGPGCVNLALFLDLETYTKTNAIVELCQKCYAQQNIRRLQTIVAPERRKS